MKSKTWIDAHCHLASEKLRPTLSEVIERSQQVGVTGWVQGGIEPTDWELQKRLKNRFGSRFRTSFGLHPWWVGQASSEDLTSGLKILDQELAEADACGELGLDFGKSHNLNRTQQLIAFKEQLRLANKYKKPLILHVVKAHSEALEILQSFAPFPAGGIVHSFSGSFEIAQKYSELGLLISIGGAITHEGYFALKKAIPLLLLTQIVVETDSPDQVPKLEGVDPKGNNEPQFLVGIAQAIAEAKGTTVEAVLSESTRNLEKLFGFK